MTVPRLLALLPVLAVAVIGWAFIATLHPGRSVSARVYGGPSPDGSTLSLLVSLVAARGDAREPVAETELEVRVSRAGQEARWRGRTDAEGAAEMRLVLGGAAAARTELEIQDAASGERLLAAAIAPSLAEWQRGERHTGWVEGQTRGDLRISVAPQAGVLAVPFPGRLHIEVKPAGRVELHVTLEGGTMLPGSEALGLPGSGALVTDANGVLDLELRPEAHALSLELSAQDQSGVQGHWYGALPVLPGALVASLEQRRLRVRSPIVRERAYVSLVDERGRWGGAIVPLTPTDEGFAVGELELAPDLLTTPLWAVVSSELDKHSPAVVGWRLGLEPAAGPSTTFAPLDQLLADGLGEARTADTLRRRVTRRRAALAAALLGLLEASLFVYEVRARGRRGRKRLALHESPEAVLGSLEPSLRHNPWFVTAALACLVLGIAALMLFGTFASP